MIHIIPKNDLRYHDETLCPCKPNIEECNGTIIVIHNSFDGREAVEQADELFGIEHKSDKKWMIIKCQSL